MSTKKIAVVPGDGIGKEVIAQGLVLLDKLREKFDLNISYEVFPWDADYYIEHGRMASDEELNQLHNQYDAIYFGALGDERIPDMAHGKDFLLKCRTKLDLFINFRPFTCLRPDLSPLRPELVKDLDIVVFRENTQGLYCQAGGFASVGGIESVAVDNCIYSRDVVERIVSEAFRWATENNRSRITLVDKSNAVPNIGKLWREVFAKYQQAHSHLQSGCEYVDAFCMHLVSKPTKYDVVVTSNLFGDIISDLLAGMCGGLGLSESSNLASSGFGLYEPIHGSAPDIAGHNIANPAAAFFTLSSLLHHLNFTTAAGYLRKGVESALADESVPKTPDLGGTGTADDLTHAVLNFLDAL